MITGRFSHPDFLKGDVATEKERIVIDNTVMRIDTTGQLFNMRQIQNRRFMFNPQTGTLILGRQYANGQMKSSHAQEHFESGTQEPFDSFIRGWVGTGRSYQNGIIHFAPNISGDNVQQFESAFSTLEMFIANNANGKTIIRGFGDKWEQPLSGVLNPEYERSGYLSDPAKEKAGNPRDKVKELTDKLEQGIKDLFDSGRYAEYLRVMSKFYRYSANNNLLIAMQRPDASLVAGYGDWQKKFHRHVKRGEHGIKILAPCPISRTVEAEKINPVTNKPEIGPDGKPVTVKQEATVAAFRVVTVFDVSQTDGEPLPKLGVNELTGDVENYFAFFEALKRVTPVPIDFEDIPSKAKGYYHLEDKRIAIRQGMSEIHTIKTAIHEITHAKLHAIDKDTPLSERKDNNTREVEAESVAYTVCQRFGIDTSDYSFAYVAGWSSDRNTKELKASMETIRKTAGELITDIEGQFQELLQQKEQQREQAGQQPTPESPLAAAEMGVEQNYNMLDGQINNLPPQQEAPGPIDAESGLPEILLPYLEKEGPFILDPDKEPVVNITWSENSKIPESGVSLPLHVADALIRDLDAERSGHSDKTDFTITFKLAGEIDTYNGSLELGAGQGLIEHIRGYAEYCLHNEGWQNYIRSQGPEAQAEETANLQFVADTFVPYLETHNRLSALETQAREHVAALRENPALDLLHDGGTQARDATMEYVDAARAELNTVTRPDDCVELNYLREVEDGKELVAFAREEMEKEQPQQPELAPQEIAPTVTDTIEAKFERGEITSLFDLMRQDEKPSVKEQIKAAKREQKAPDKAAPTKPKKEMEL